jgi:hypothetical protein
MNPVILSKERLLELIYEVEPHYLEAIQVTVGNEPLDDLVYLIHVPPFEEPIDFEAQVQRGDTVLRTVDFMEATPKESKWRVTGIKSPA